MTKYSRIIVIGEGARELIEDVQRLKEIIGRKTTSDFKDVFRCFHNTTPYICISEKNSDKKYMYSLELAQDYKREYPEAVMEEE